MICILAYFLREINKILFRAGFLIVIPAPNREKTIWRVIDKSGIGLVFFAQRNSDTPQVVIISLLSILYVFDNKGVSYSWEW